MEFTWHDFIRGLVIAFPVLVMAIVAGIWRHRRKKNKEVSEVLRTPTS